MNRCEICNAKVDHIGELSIMRGNAGLLLVCKNCMPKNEKKNCGNCKHKEDIFKAQVLCDLYKAWFSEDFCCDSQWKPQ